MRRFTVKKRYGEYKTSDCPFCGKIATQKNDQGLEVCRFHAKTKLDEIKCTCGRWLETRSGKFGPYFHCLNCGNINYNKGLAMKEMTTPTFQKELESSHSTGVLTSGSQTSSIRESKYSAPTANERPDRREHAAGLLTSGGREYFDEEKKEIKKEDALKERKETVISSHDVEYFD